MAEKISHIDSVRNKLDEIGVTDQQLIIGLENYLLGNRRIQLSVRSQIREMIAASDDPLETIATFAELVRPVVPRKSSHNETRIAAQTLTIQAKGEGKIPRQEPSSAFALGAAAHHVAERIYKFPLDKILADSGARLSCVDGEIRAFYFESRQKVKNQYTLPFDQPKTLINLQVPIKAPDSGELTAKWVLENLAQEMTIIGEMPIKTYDVDQILNEPNLVRRQSFIKVLEICQMAFGNSSAMSIIGGAEGEEFVGKESITPFRALNWLGLMALTIEVNNKRKEAAEPKVGLLSELSLGKICFSTDKEKTGRESIVVYGGKYDLLEIKISNIGPQKRDLNTLTKAAEWEFPRYKQRYRKKDSRGHDLGGKLGRNLYSYLWFLRKEYGPEFFSNIEITGIDFKFPGGDGDMWKTFDINRLPMAKHLEQMQNYIFLTLCQLYVLKGQSMEQGVGDGLVTINTKDVVKFAVDSGLINKVKIKLNYQIPGKNQIFEVAAANGEELQIWADRRIDQAFKLYPEYERRRLLEMVSLILGQGKKVEIERRIENRPPVEIAAWCRLREGHNYFLLAEFEKNKDYELVKAQNYNQGVLVIWLKIPGQQEQVRIALRKDGRFRITGLPDTTGVVSGSMCSSEENICKLESKNELWEKVQSELWRYLQQNINQNFCLEENQWLMGGYFTNANGSLVERQKDKPIVWSLDAFTGVEYLEPDLLKKAIDEQGERDTYGFREIASNLDKKKDNLQVRCPRPNHRNSRKGSEAATMHPNIIYCHRCNVGMHIRGDGTEFGEIKPLPSSDYPDHYKPVSDDRNKSMHEYISAADRLSRLDQTLDTYLGSRGLTRKDLGPCGYIPLEISRSMSLILTQAKRMHEKTGSDIWKWKVVKNLKVAWFVEMLKSKGETDLYQWAKKQIEHNYPIEILNNFWNSLDLDTLDQWRRRGLVGSETETSWDRMGGRVIVPTGWMAKYDWRWCNVNARGIVLNEKELYEGVSHHKAFLIRSQEELRPPPPGMWIRNWERFLTEVTDTVLVGEGAITMASFFKLVPGWEYKTIAGMGLPVKQLVAFFRWLGVEGYDPKDKHVSHGKNIKRIIFAPDFDEGGVSGWENFRETFSLAFPGVVLEPVHNILKGTGIENLVRPYDPKLYQENGEFFEKPKIDFNDIWLHVLGRKEIYI